MKRLLLYFTFYIFHFTFASAFASTTVPVTVVEGNHMPLVDAVLDGRRATLILDTGASHTTFDLGFVTNAFPGVKLIEPVMVGESNAFAKPRFLAAKTLSIGGRDIAVEGVMALDLSHLDASVGRNVDGILGMDVLRPQRFILSLARSELVFVDEPSEVPPGFVRVPSRLDSSGCYNLLATLPDGTKRAMLLDSGSTYTFLAGTNSWPLAESASSLAASDVNGRAPLAFHPGLPGLLTLGPTNFPVAPLLLARPPLDQLGSDFLLKADLLHVPSHIFLR